MPIVKNIIIINDIPANQADIIAIIKGFINNKKINAKLSVSKTNANTIVFYAKDNKIHDIICELCKTYSTSSIIHKWCEINKKDSCTNIYSNGALIYTLKQTN